MRWTENDFDATEYLTQARESWKTLQKRLRCSCKPIDRPSLECTPHPPPPTPAAQIANVGFIDVDRNGVSDAVARGTYFIHGSSTGSGSQKFAHGAAVTLAHAFATVENREDQPLCKAACGLMLSSGKNEDGMLHVCDPSCAPGDQGGRFDGYLCGAGDSATFGEGCRTCYTDQAKAAKAEEELRMDEGPGDSDRHGRHVIMCDTLRPPSSPECSSKCSIKPDTVSAEASACACGRL